MAFNFAQCVAMALAVTGLMNINKCGINMTPRQFSCLGVNHLR